MNHKVLGLFLVIFALAFLPPATPAMADAIDGDWCFSDGRHFSIDGPEIVTPAGTKMVGNYGRHSFLYIVPSVDVGAGQIVRMIQLNENAIQVTNGASDGSATSPTQIWQRCRPVTS